MNNNFLETRNIRIFISSTFKDMQRERNQLNKVFHKLRKIAAERNVTLTEIDLRWGIKEEEVQSGNVVDICMDEIQNSHPFFIGLLGNRYGWCPTEKELNSISPKYQWIMEDIKKGLSITEIEMQYAAIRATTPVHASFYILNEPPPSDILDQRQENLKEKIRNNGRYPVYDYNTSEELGVKVEQELTKLIEQLFPQEEAIDTVHRERMMQQACINDRTEKYIPNPAYLSCLNNFLQDKDNSYTVVTGESGMGKSSLLAFWVKSIQTQDDWNVITYFAAGSIFEPDYREISQKLIAEIDFLYQLKDMEDIDRKIEKETSNEKIEEEKLSLRADRIQGGKPLLILLDGVNQYTDDDNRTKLMNWLPEFAGNVKIIFSTTEEDSAMETFRRLNYPAIKIYPLLSDQRKELIVEFFEKYRKHLSDEQLNCILNASNITENTMVLISLLEEIRSFGDFDNFGTFINEMTNQPDYESFFDHLLLRKEKTYNTQKHPCLVEEFLSLIALSKDGLTETEIVNISGIPILYWSLFFCANNLHFILKSGRITFSHNLIAQAVKRRYIESAERAEKVKELRLRIIRYFENGETEASRKMAEYPYQLHQIQNWDLLFEFISSLDYLRHQIDNKNIPEFVQYWSALKEIGGSNYPITVYINKITVFEGGDSDNVMMDAMVRQATWQFFRSYFYHLVNICIKYLKDIDSSYEIGRFILKMTDLSPREDNRYEKAHSHDMLGAVSLEKKDYHQALTELYEALKIYIDLYGENDFRITNSLFNIGEVYNCMGEARDESVSEPFRKAEIIFRKVLDIRIEIFGEMHSEVAVAYANLGSVYSSLGETEKADFYSEKSRSIYVKINGENDIDVAIEYHNHAVKLLNRANHDIAGEYSLKALNIFLQLVGENNPHTIEEYVTLATIESRAKQYATAIPYMEKVVSLSEKTNGKNILLAEYLNTLTTYYIFDNQLEMAEETGLTALGLLDELGEAYSVLSAVVHDNLGKAYLKLNREKDSTAHYRQAIGIWRQQGDKEKEAASYFYLASALGSFSRMQETLDALNKSLTLLQQCRQDVSEMAAYANNNAGVTHYKLGNTKKALEHIKIASAIRLELFGEHDEIFLQYQQTAEIFQKQMDENILNYGKNQKLKNDTTPNTSSELAAELEEFNQHTGNDRELETLFIQARDAFNSCNVEKAIQLFELAIYTCRKYDNYSNTLTEAILLRYLAFSYEQAKNYQKAKELYNKAANIARNNKNAGIAQRIYKDMAEFNWNRGNFEDAEFCYWYEINYSLQNGGFYNEKTLTGLNNAAQAIIKQDNSPMNVAMACFDLVYSLTGKMDESESLRKCAGDAICRILDQLEKEDPSLAGKQHQIDREKALLTLIDYLIDINAFSTANEIINTYLSTIAAKEGMPIESFCMLHFQMMLIENHYGNFHQIINIALWLKENVDEHNLSESIQQKINLLLARAYTETLQYERAIPILKLYPASAKGRITLSECYRATGNKEEALAILNNLLEEDPDVKSYNYFQFVYGKALLDNGKINSALNYLKEYSKNREWENLEVDIHIAYALHLSGKEMEALQTTHSVMENLNDNEISLIYQLKTYISLAFYMLKIKNKHEAERVNNKLKELINHIREEHRDPYSTQSTTIQKGIDELKNN